MSLSNLNLLPLEYTITRLDAISPLPLSIILLLGLIQIFFYSILRWESKIYVFFLGFSVHDQAKKIGFSSNQQSTHTKHKKLQEDHDDDKRICISIYREDVEIVLNSLGILSSSEIAGEISNSDVLESSWFEEEDEDGNIYYYKVEEVKAAFDVFDENKDGFIDAYELQRVLCALGFKQGLDFENCRKMIKLAAHVNGDHGRLDFNEFVNFLEKGVC